MKLRSVSFIAGAASIALLAVGLPGPVAALESSAPEPAPVVDATVGSVDQLIVAYEPGVNPQEAPNVATGDSVIPNATLVPGEAIGSGMRTVELSEPVSTDEAQVIAAKLTADPRIKWAEPDRLIRPSVVYPLVDVSVTNPDGSALLSNAYQYVAPLAPTLSSVQPASGLAAGGEAITLAGTGLAGVTQVTFGGVAAAITNRTDLALTVTAPPHADGLVDVFVRSAAGTRTLTGGYRYYAPPTVSALSVSSGRTTGGQSVTLTGTFLSSASSVRFGTTAATITSRTATTVTVTTPAASAGVVSVSVTTPGGSATLSNAFTYVLFVPAPIVSSVSPSSGTSLGGSIVSIVGSNLDTVSAVQFGGVAATIRSRAATFLSVVAPAHAAGLVNVTVTTAGGTATRTSAFSYINLPRVSTLSVTAGPTRGGTRVTLFGNFLSATSSVSFGGVAAVILSRTDTSVVVTTPARVAGTVTVSLTTPLGTAVKSSAYTYVAPPTFSALSPTVGSTAGGERVTLTGTNLALTSRVSFGGVSASIQSRSATAVVVLAPARAAGTVSVALTTPGGTVSRLSSYTYSTLVAPPVITGVPATAASEQTSTGVAAPATVGSPAAAPATAAAPTLTGISLAQGSADGGVLVTLTGTNLASVTDARFGSQSATIVSQSDTSLTVLTPAAVVFNPTDPYLLNNALWGVTGQFGVHAPTAWAHTTGSSNVIVAVVDTGQVAHADAGVMVPGYDMISDPLMANDGDGRDADPSDPGDWVSFSDTQGYFAGCPIEASSWHGTHVSGTIAAAANGVGVIGVAPGVRIEPVRALGKCGGMLSDIIAGVTWASGGSVFGVPTNPNPAQVINMSLGGDGVCGVSMQSAINAAVARGVSVVVAAGNANSNAATSFPANCANTIVVGATDQNGRRASFSNYGSIVDVSAPGVGIWSTVDLGSQGPSASGFASYSGTSMATPHVAAVIALMLSRDPSLTPAQVEARLKATVQPFGAATCDVNATLQCGAGIVNAGAAVP